jgi:hypothetical protein
MFLYFTAFDFLSWRLLGDRSFYSTPMRIFAELLICLAAGWLFGVFSAAHRKRVDPTNS